MRKFCLILLLTALVSACHGFQNSDRADLESQYELTRRFVGKDPNVEVLLHLSRKEIDLSDFLVAAIEVRAKDGARIIEPYLSEDVYQPLSLIGSPRATGFWSPEKERHIKIWEYKFEPSGAGRFSLKPIEVFFRPYHIIETEEIHYLVQTAAKQEDDIKDIKEAALPVYDYLPLTVAAGILFLIALSFYLARGYGRKREGKEPEPMSNRDSFLEAMRKLDELERQDLIEKGELELLHVRLSRILRYYIENYFGIRAPEQTTEEFLKHIGESSFFSVELQTTLRDFLSLSDLVKFSAFEPQTGVNEEAMRQVRAFIVATGEETNEI